MTFPSLPCSQSEILQREVYLTRRLEDDPTTLPSTSPLLGADDATGATATLPVVALLRPTPDVFTLLARELRRPRYAAFHLFFTNRVPDSTLHALADADSGERVKQIQEIFGDYLLLDQHCFVAPISQPAACLAPPNWMPAASSHALETRSVQALAAVLLSLKRKPLVRYQGNSVNARRVADELFSLSYRQEAELFDFGQTRRHEQPPTVLVLDRLDDPVTPLLSQWTYQAMVEELLDVTDHAVRLGEGGEPLVMSPLADAFYAQHAHEDFGALGESVRGLMSELSAAQPRTSASMNLEDMKRVLEDFPQYRSLKRVTAKHVECLNVISKRIGRRGLMAQGALEYAIAAGPAALASHVAQVEAIVLGSSSGKGESKRSGGSGSGSGVPRPGPVPDVEPTDLDKVRLLLLLSLRYELDVESVVSRLGAAVAQSARTRVGRQAPRLVKVLSRLSNRSTRTGDIFKSRGVLGQFTGALGHLARDGGGEWYKSHTPLVAQTVRELLKGSNSANMNGMYPVAGGEAFGVAGGMAPPPRHVVVFMVGGWTWAEARALRAVMWETKGCTLQLGGTSVVNAVRFTESLADLADAANV